MICVNKKPILTLSVADMVFLFELYSCAGLWLCTVWRALYQTHGLCTFILPKSNITQYSALIPRMQSFNLVTPFVTLKIILSSFHKMTKIYFLLCTCYKISPKMSNFDLVLSYALSVRAAAKTSMKAYLQVEKETRGGHYLVLSFRALFPILIALICKFRLYSIKTVEEVGA